jgi:multidrug resistance efflux pump
MSALATEGGATELRAAAPVQVRPRLRRKPMLLAAGALLTAAGAAWYGHDWWVHGRFVEVTDDAYVGGDITVIAPKVAGLIAEVAVTDNQKVQAGDLLVKLDDRDYGAALARAEAAVAGQQATLANLDAQRRLQAARIAEAQAEITAADAEVTRSRDDQLRYKQLSDTAAASIQSFQKADAVYKQAVAGGTKTRAALDAAQRQIEVIDTQKRQTEAALAGAVADRDTARLNLGYTELRAPIDGVIGNRSARLGAYAPVGAQLIALVPGLFVTIVVPLLVRVDRPNFTLLKNADYLGMVLMALFLGCLEYVLEEGPRWDWFGDETIRDAAWVSGIAGIGFLWRSLTHAQPVVDLRALESLNFALGCLFSFVTGIGVFSTIYLTPVFLGEVRGYSALQIGAAIFSTGLFQVSAIPFYSMLTRRIDLRWLLMFGLGLFALSMWNFTPITSDWGGAQLLLPQALRGFAQQFAVAPTVTLTLGGLAPDRLKLASGLFNLMRNLGGAIGIAVCGTILNDRTNLHFLRLAEHLNPANPAMMDLVQRTSLADAAKHGGNLVLGQAEALKQLAALTLREAQTQSFADAFLAIMGCFVIATLLVPLLRKVAPPKAPTADAH